MTALLFFLLGVGFSLLQFPFKTKLTFNRNIILDLTDPGLKNTVFEVQKIQRYASETEGDDLWRKVSEKMKNAQIFYGITKLTLPTKKTTLAQDMLIGITIHLAGPLYITSYNRVSTYYDSGDELIIVLSACHENLIDGYYRLHLRRDRESQTITLVYAKVQSLVPLLFKLLPKHYYHKINDTSINRTVNKLFE